MRIFFCMAPSVRTASGSDRIYHPTFDRAVLRRVFLVDSSDPVATARGSDTPVATARGSDTLSTRQFRQFTYSRHDSSGKTFYFFRAVIRGAKGIADLLLAQLRQDSTNPFGLFNGNVVEQMLVFAAVIKNDFALVYAFNELCIGDILLWPVSRVA